LRFLVFWSIGKVVNLDYRSPAPEAGIPVTIT
jgi:hypothetical protein